VVGGQRKQGAHGRGILSGLCLADGVAIAGLARNGAQRHRDDLALAAKDPTAQRRVGYAGQARAGHVVEYDPREREHMFEFHFRRRKMENWSANTTFCVWSNGPADQLI
jgi:hypothetical protein